MPIPKKNMQNLNYSNNVWKKLKYKSYKKFKNKT